MFNIGSAKYPMDPLSPNSALEDVDHVVFSLLDIISQAINTNLDASWQAKAATCDLLSTYPKALNYNTPVSPFDFGQSSSLTFPLLWIDRELSEYEDESLNTRTATTSFSIYYVLPPFTAEQAEIMIPYRKAAADVIFRTLMANQTIKDIPNLSEINITTAEYQNWQIESDQIFPAVRIRFSAEEKMADPTYPGEPYPDGQPLEWIDTDVLDGQLDPEEPILLAEEETYVGE